MCCLLSLLTCNAGFPQVKSEKSIPHKIQEPVNPDQSLLANNLGEFKANVVFFFIIDNYDANIVP